MELRDKVLECIEWIRVGHRLCGKRRGDNVNRQDNDSSRLDGISVGQVPLDNSTECHGRST